jgi:outer membrane protein TolC
MEKNIMFLFLLISINALSQINKSVPIKEQDKLVDDSVVQNRLVALAMQNPVFAEADALINSAQFELKRAKSAWMNTVVVSGNINEFVINNTTINGLPASTLYPKYNFGINVPLGLFSRQEKNISREKVKQYEAQKDSRVRAIRKEVLIRYENYKEKKMLFELQKQLTEGQYSTYQQRQKDYANRELNDLKEVNKEYILWVEQRSQQRTREKDLLVAELELEEIIGMKLSDALNSASLNK